MDTLTRQKLVNRLASAHGHLAAIRRLLEQGAHCPEVLYQLRAVRRALECLEQRLVETHLHDCLARSEGMTDELADDILELWHYRPGST